MVLTSMQLQKVSVTLWFRRFQCLVLRSVLSVFIDLRSAECVCSYYGLRVCSWTNKLKFQTFQEHRHIFQQLSNYSQVYLTRSNKRVYWFFFKIKHIFLPKNIWKHQVTSSQNGKVPVLGKYEQSRLTMSHSRRPSLSCHRIVHQNARLVYVKIALESSRTAFLFTSYKVRYALSPCQ